MIAGAGRVGISSGVAGITARSSGGKMMDYGYAAGIMNRRANSAARQGDMGRARLFWERQSNAERRMFAQRDMMS